MLLWTCEWHRLSKGLCIGPDRPPADISILWERRVSLSIFMTPGRLGVGSPASQRHPAGWLGQVLCIVAQCRVQGCSDHSRGSWCQANHIGKNSKARVDALLQHCHQMICEKRPQGSHACVLQLAAVPRVCHEHFWPWSSRVNVPKTATTDVDQAGHQDFALDLIEGCSA